MDHSEYQAFIKWLAERQKHFNEVSASPADIAQLALQDGFSKALVSQWEQHQRWESLGKSS